MFRKNTFKFLLNLQLARSLSILNRRKRTSPVVSPSLNLKSAGTWKIVVVFALVTPAALMLNKGEFRRYSRLQSQVRILDDLVAYSSPFPVLLLLLVPGQGRNQSLSVSQPILFLQRWRFLSALPCLFSLACEGAASQPASSSRVLCCRESSEAERTDVRRRNFLPSRCSSLPLASLSPVRFVSHVLRGVAGETSLVFRASAFGPSVCTLELRSNDDRPMSKRARCNHGFAKIRICSVETAQSLSCVS